MNRICRLRARWISAAGAILSAFALVLLAGCDRRESAADSSGPMEISYGSRISFAKGGNSERYRAGGWSTTEDKFTWSEGTSAQLRIPVPATNDPVTLKVRMAALVKPPELPYQPVEVFINDQKIAEWQVGDTSEFTAAIPGDLTKRGGTLNILIKTPKATSPKALGINADSRVLGVCCLDLEMSRG